MRLSPRLASVVEPAIYPIYAPAPYNARTMVDSCSRLTRGPMKPVLSAAIAFARFFLMLVARLSAYSSSSDSLAAAMLVVTPETSMPDLPHSPREDGRLRTMRRSSG